MNIERVRAKGETLQPPYGCPFTTEVTNAVWGVFVEDFDWWAFGDDPIVSAGFVIPGVKELSAVVVPSPDVSPTHFRMDTGVAPVTEDGVLYLKSLISASGKVRWMNPDL